MNNVFAAPSLAVVALAGAYLVTLGVAALLRPRVAKRFLRGFAGTPGKHYVELCTRLLVGAAFIVSAPRMAWPLPFAAFGWVLVGTTLLLALMPWRKHKRFAEYSVSRAMPHLAGVGVASLCAGAAVLASAYAAGAA